MTTLGPEPPLEDIRRETTANHEAFQRQRDNFTRHEGTYALMKSGMIVDFFRDRQSALLAGHERFIDRLFSVHRVLAHERHRSGAASRARQSRKPRTPLFGLG